MSSSRRSASLLPFLLRLLAIATLFSAIAILPATAVPANDFADLKRLLADPSVSRIEVKADIKLREDLPEVSRSIRITGHCRRRRPCVLTAGLPGTGSHSTKPITITGKCRGGRGGRCVIDGRGKFRTFIFQQDVTMENIEIRRAALTAVDARAGFVGRNLVFSRNRHPVDAPGPFVRTFPFAGGLFVRGNFSISNSLFTQNTGFFGVALTAEGDGGFTSGVVSRCTFTENVAAEDGGAVKFLGDRRGTLYRVADSTFTRNTAKRGGAIFSSEGGQLEIVRSTFKNNRASSPEGINAGGGAIRTSEAEKLSVCNCRFSGNTAIERNSSNLFVRQTTDETSETLFCPSQPPLTEFLCNFFSNERIERIPCYPITIGGPACATCR